MKFKDKYNIEKEYAALFAFPDPQAELLHNEKMISSRFLSEIEQLCEEKKMKKKDLAAAIGTSASYVTQLFNGDKLLNMATLAKIESFFSVRFDATVKQQEAIYHPNAAITDLTGLLQLTKANNLRRLPSLPLHRMVKASAHQEPAENKSLRVA